MEPPAASPLHLAMDSEEDVLFVFYIAGDNRHRFPAIIHFERMDLEIARFCRQYRGCIPSNGYSCDAKGLWWVHVLFSRRLQRSHVGVVSLAGVVSLLGLTNVKDPMATRCAMLTIR